MKAVVLSEFGGPENLQLREVTDPITGPGQIKVRMAGASVNPVDWKQRSGALQKFMPLDLPTVLGKDAAGVVIEVGPGVTAFRTGDRLLGRVNGGYAEQVVATVEDWAAVPAGMEVADAGALPLVLLTGAQLVEEAVNVQQGEHILVTGAAGSVGRVAVFAAKARGARVYAGVRASQRAAGVEINADVVVALDDPAELAKLPQLDSVADTVGGEVMQALLDKLKRGGTVGSVVGEPAGAKARGLVVKPMLAHSDAKRLSQLAQAVADGKLLIPIARRFPLAEAAAAHRLAESGAGGKVLLIG